MRHFGENYRNLLLMTLFCAMIAGGCAPLQTSGIDPTGEHVFAAPPAVVNAQPAVINAPPIVANAPPATNPATQLEPLPWDPVKIIVTPSVTAAPVNSEVVLIAGVGSADGHLRCNQRVNWNITSGIGQFVDVGKNDFVDILLGDYNRPRVVTYAYAIGSTASKDEQVKRASASPADNICVTQGQSWVKVSSPVEGISVVTVTAPKIADIGQRVKTATIYWTDAVWRFPPPAINPAGSKHVFTTTVMRQSNQSPLPGWRVKYTIMSGPPAGFSPAGGSSIEVPTDAAGQANVEIFQKSPAHGTNQINIEVVRPSELPGANGQRMVVGTGSVMKTWTASDIAVKLSGPSMIAAGSTLTYRLEVSNPGDLPSKNIMVENILPDGLSYIDSNPPASFNGKKLQWPLNELGPRLVKTIEINVRADKEGSVVNCAEATTAAGLKVSNCATTTVTAAEPAADAPAAASPPSAATSSGTPLVEIQVQGPNRATIGSDVTFNITVFNRGQTNLNNLIVKDRFDPGLEHAQSKDKRSIEATLPDLPPGRSAKLDVTFRVTKAGNLCHTVDVVRQGTRMASKQACVPVWAQTTPPPGILPQGGQTPSGITPGITLTTPQPSATARAPVINVKHTVPQPSHRTMGDMVLFSIQITNPNNLPLNNLKVLYHWDPALIPTRTAPECQLEGKNLMWILPILPAGSVKQIDVECRCAKVSSKATNSASVSSSEGSQAQTEASLEIRPAPGATPPGRYSTDDTSPGSDTRGGTRYPDRTRTEDTRPADNRYGRTTPEPAQSASGLVMTVAALRNPVAAGKELTYEIRVVNNGKEVERQVTITAKIPSGMTPNVLGTTGPGQTKPLGDASPGLVGYYIDRQTVNFNPVMTLQPGEALVYRVRVRTKTPGPKFVFTAEMTSQNLTQPDVKEAFTEVF